MDAAYRKDADNPRVLKTQYTSDPRLEVNERMSKDRRPKCNFPRQANVARRVLHRKRRYPGVPMLISRRGEKWAFKLIPISTKDLLYMGCRFSRYVCLYISLFFGWQPSPANWGTVSTRLMQFIAARRPDNAHSERPEAYVANKYVDDGAFLDPWLSLRPWQPISLWGSAICRFLGPAAVDIEKRDLDGPSDTQINLRGITLCTASNTFTLLAEKISRASEFPGRPILARPRRDYR